MPVSDSMSVPGRMLLGFLSAAVAVLVCQQGSWALLHLAALMPPPYPTVPVAPFGLPRIANLCFWGGLWGAAFALVSPRLGPQWWPWGVVLGVLTVLVATFVVPAIKGVPGAAIMAGTTAQRFGIGLALNVPFGVGTALFLRLLTRRRKRFQ